MAELLEKYYRSEVDLILHHLENIPGRFAEEDIHRVRVGIKKIRAVHRLLGASFPDLYTTKELNRPYKKIFRSFGRYREAQINMALLRKHGATRRFRKYYHASLKADMDNIKRDILDALSSFSPGRGEPGFGELAEGLSMDEEIIIMHSYIEKERIRALKVLSEYENSKDLHSVRIILKNIKPFLKLLSQQDASKFTRKDFNSLNRIETRIGNWHDRVVLADALSLFIKDSTDDYSLLKAYNKITRRLGRRDNRRKVDRLVGSVSGCLESFAKTFLSI